MVGLIARKGNFALSATSAGRRGYGQQRLNSVLYNELSKLSNNKFSIEKVEIGVGSSDFMRRLTSIADLFYLNMKQFDIIHAPTPLFARPLRMKRSAKLITTSHGISTTDKSSPCYYAQNLKVNRGFRNDIINYIGHRQTLTSDFIIAVSSLTKRRIVERGFESKRIFVVNNSLDDRFTKTPLHKYRAKHKKFVIGYLGPFYRNKNVVFAIRAFRKIDDKNMEFQIWGRKIYDYPNMVEAACNDKRIKFMGVAPESRIVRIYDNFDAFVYPTICDQFPASIIEAQTRGLPVVTYSKGEMSAESRRYCIEAEDEDDMASILENIKQNGYDDKSKTQSTNYARSFTAEKQAKETLEVYKKVYDN